VVSFFRFSHYGNGFISYWSSDICFWRRSLPKATEDNWEHSGCGRRMFSGARLNRSIKFSSMSRARPLILRSDGPDRRFQFHKRSQLFIGTRRPLSRCASAIQIVRPLESIAETQPQVHPALLRLQRSQIWRWVRPIPKERGQITSGVALQNPTHASSLPIDCRRWCC
jgi:hypothetical protein